MLRKVRIGLAAHLHHLQLQALSLRRLRLRLSSTVNRDSTSNIARSQDLVGYESLHVGKLGKRRFFDKTAKACWKAKELRVLDVTFALVAFRGRTGERILALFDSALGRRFLPFSSECLWLFLLCGSRR